MTRQIRDLPTPALLLDRAGLDRNLARMRAIAERWPGLVLRPHLKTAKAVEVARLAVGADGPITVSTLHEAEAFFAAGYRDILYAVGFEPGKIGRARALIAQGCRLGLILDHIAVAHAVVEAGLAAAVSIEIDSDGHRAGLKPDDPAIVAIGRLLHGAGLTVGVMTHAGGASYAADGLEAIRRVAEDERDAVVRAAARLRDAGVPVASVSVGSTPTMLMAEDFTGVTEMRPGVYMFGDLVMAGLGVMDRSEIALSVLTSVIGHRADRNWLLTDAGWMALSRDRGTASQRVDQGFGLVLGESGEYVGDLITVSANQEHGIVTRRDGGPVDYARFPVGSRLRILPNHACATAAQHAGYHVIGADGAVEAWWPRLDGW